MRARFWRSSSITTNVLLPWLLLLLIVAGLASYHIHQSQEAADMEAHSVLHRQSVQMAGELQLLSLRRWSNVLAYQATLDPRNIKQWQLSEIETRRKLDELAQMFSGEEHYHDGSVATQAGGLLEAYRLIREGIPELYAQLFQAIDAGERDHQMQLIRLLNERRHLTRAALDDLVNYHLKLEQLVKEQQQAALLQADWIFFTLLAVLLLAGFFFSGYQTLAIVHPLRNLTLAARKVGAGETADLARFKGQGEIGELSDALVQMVSALRENAETLSAISETAADAILLLDAAGKIAHWNAAATTLFGYSRDEALGQDLHRLLAPERFHTTHQVAYARFLLNGQGAAIGKTMELAALHQDGHEIAIELSLSALQRQDGWNAVGILRDITERKRSVVALLEAEQKYRRLFDSLRDAFGMIDMAGNMTDCNLAFQEMLGYSKEEVLRLTYQELTPEKWHTFEAEIIENQIIPEGISQVYEKEYIRKDGTVLPVEVRAFLVRDKDGQPESMWGLVRDITERKRNEERIYTQLDELRRWQQLTQGREGRILSVKQEVNELLAAQGLPPRYPSALDETPAREAAAGHEGMPPVAGPEDQR